MVSLESLKNCGINVSHHEPVYGGDINQCYCLYEGNKKYFLKVNDAKQYPSMFEKEANGLIVLKNNSSLTIPEVIKHGTIDSEQYLLLQWMEKGKPQRDFWKNFGEALAMMHKKPQPHFGFEEDNFIGSLPQNNTKHDSWHSFYAECRIMPLVKNLFDSAAFSNEDIAMAENFCDHLNEIFPPEHSSLLHGDLWSGNYMTAENGYAAIYDPAVYFGHREMDIGMTKLFGGFDEKFYDAYNEIYPLEKNWQQRLRFAQLYPLLVHAVLFGGHYVSSVKEIFKNPGGLN